jgi:hypothetical protein
MTDEERQQIKLDALGGERAAKLWGDALNALHAYAQASGCPPGLDVVRWFSSKTAEYQDAMTAAVRASHQENASG